MKIEKLGKDLVKVVIRNKRPWYKLKAMEQGQNCLDCFFLKRVKKGASCKLECLQIATKIHVPRNKKYVKVKDR